MKCRRVGSPELEHLSPASRKLPHNQVRLVALLLALPGDGKEHLVPLCRPPQEALQRIGIGSQGQADVRKRRHHELQQLLWHLVHRCNREDLWAPEMPCQLEHHRKHPDFHGQPLAKVRCDIHAAEAHEMTVFLDLVFPKRMELSTRGVVRPKNLDDPDIVGKGDQLIEVVPGQRHTARRLQLRRRNIPRLIVGCPLGIIGQRLVCHRDFRERVLARRAVRILVWVPPAGQSFVSPLHVSRLHVARDASSAQ
mmetsp:Transcript_173930/g.557507  ORF Transcript_173930/g.557507 Transcript_173930/m.557507 type:complete len:252 (-) Transcript_173930:507-1262(-)